jgi:hypothetical protein
MLSDTPSVPSYSTQNLNHLGLVSGITQDLGIFDLIDQYLPSDPKSRLSNGQVVLAMLINGLGFTTRPMYLRPQFFGNKPVDVQGPRWQHFRQGPLSRGDRLPVSRGQDRRSSDALDCR